MKVTSQLPKYQSPKRKRSSSGEAHTPINNLTKTPSDFAPKHGSLLYRSNSDKVTPVSRVSRSMDAIKPVGLRGIRAEINTSKSGDTTLQDTSHCEANVSGAAVEAASLSISLASSTNSPSEGSHVKNNTGILSSRPHSPDIVSFHHYDHSKLMRSPVKMSLSQRMLFDEALCVKISESPRLPLKPSGPHSARRPSIIGCSCTSGNNACSGCKWRSKRDFDEDEDLSDDEAGGKFQQMLHFSDEDSVAASDITLHELEENELSEINTCVEGQMSSLRVDKNRRLRGQQDEWNLEQRFGSPDSFGGSLYSRANSPDLGFSGTPVFSVDSPADVFTGPDRAHSASRAKRDQSRSPLPITPPIPATVRNLTALFESSTQRPVPSQSAFDRKFMGSPTFLSKNCPATPLRPPHYLNSGDDQDAVRRPAGIYRTNSLAVNKVLLSQSEITEDAEVSFHRDFEDEGVLGSGQFSTVFLGRAKDGSGRVCAIKRLNSQFRSRKERDFHLNEVRTMERIGKVPCDFVLHFFTAWQEDGHLYVDLEFAANGTLRDLNQSLNLRGERCSDEAAWCILHDVTRGLKHIHSCGFVHLDIKPANILIAANGVLKIGDFGNAVPIGEDRDGSEGDTR